MTLQIPPPPCPPAEWSEGWLRTIAAPALGVDPTLARTADYPTLLVAMIALADETPPPQIATACAAGLVFGLLARKTRRGRA